MSDSDLQTLAGWMTGQFDNLEQSQRDPTWFVSLRLWCRALPPAANRALNQVAQTENGIGLFVEQAPLPAGDRPYRQRLLLLSLGLGLDLGAATVDRAMRVHYFGFHDQRPYIGAGREPQRLETIQPNAIQTLSNGEFPLVRSGDRFISRSETDQVCSFQFDNKPGHVSLGFEISATGWQSFDRGIDPDTGRSLWGALMGPYQFLKS